MKPKGTNVWSNFSYGSRTDTPDGCLLNPEGSRLIFFETCKKSPQNNIRILRIHFIPITLESRQGLNL